MLNGPPIIISSFSSFRLQWHSTWCQAWWRWGLEITFHPFRNGRLVDTLIHFKSGYAHRRAKFVRAIFPNCLCLKEMKQKKKQLNYKSKRKGVERLRVQSKQRRRLKFHRKHGVSVTCTCHLCVCAYVPPPVPGSVPRSRWSASCCTSSRRTWSPIASSDTRWSTAGGGGGQVESWWYGMKGKIIMSTKNIRENLNSIFGKQLS